MIEIIAMAGAGAMVLGVVIDIATDGPGDLWRRMETLRIFSGLAVTHVTTVQPGDTERIDAWLEKHAGTTELTDDDKLFFAEQLRLSEEKLRDAH